jgi:hypothetical protein
MFPRRQEGVPEKARGRRAHNNNAEKMDALHVKTGRMKERTVLARDL